MTCHPIEGLFNPIICSHLTSIPGDTAETWCHSLTASVHTNCIRWELFSITKPLFERKFVSLPVCSINFRPILDFDQGKVKHFKVRHPPNWKNSNLSKNQDDYRGVLSRPRLIGSFDEQWMEWGWECSWQRPQVLTHVALPCASAQQLSNFPNVTPLHRPQCISFPCLKCRQTHLDFWMKVQRDK